MHRTPLILIIKYL